MSLAICSALAVTTKMGPTLIMCAAVIFVLCMSNTIISLLRSYIPTQIRIIVMLTVISTVVTVVSLVLQALAYDLSKQITSNGITRDLKDNIGAYGAFFAGKRGQ